MFETERPCSLIIQSNINQQRGKPRLLSANNLLVTNYNLWHMDCFIKGITQNIKTMKTNLIPEVYIPGQSSCDSDDDVRNRLLFVPVPIVQSYRSPYTLFRHLYQFAATQMFDGNFVL